MKLNLSNIWNCILLRKYLNVESTKRLCSLVGFTNVMSCIFFYYWIITTQISYSTNITLSLFLVSAITHTYINSVLINWTLPYENAKWMKWTWLSLVCVSPLGLMLIYLGTNDAIWNNTKIEDKKKNTPFHSLTNSFVHLPNILNKAIHYLQAEYPREFSEIVKAAELDLRNVDGWNQKVKYLMIALSECLRQTKKKKATFDDLVFGAHWYDQRHFDFAIKDPKGKVVPNLRYKYAFGFVVLDEFNNYQKILDAKKEIKANMKFGPAKAICLHWGKGFKVYVNE